MAEEEEIELNLLKKFRDIVNISEEVRKSEVASYLGISETELFEKLVRWGKKIPFKIKKDTIVIDNMSGFINALDNQFKLWEKKEQTKIGKKPLFKGKNSIIQTSKNSNVQTNMNSFLSQIPPAPLDEIYKICKSFPNEANTFFSEKNNYPFFESILTMHDGSLLESVDTNLAIWLSCATKPKVLNLNS
ncbi:MAG: hypothetical protein ACTSWY_10625 [Promethearchaeota archaeon]